MIPELKEDRIFDYIKVPRETYMSIKINDEYRSKIIVGRAYNGPSTFYLMIKREKKDGD